MSWRWYNDIPVLKGAYQFKTEYREVPFQDSFNLEFYFPPDYPENLPLVKYEWEERKTEKPAFLVINQKDGHSIHIWLLTDERISSSVFTDIIPYRGGQRIFYTYSNEESPANKEKNPSHEGFCQLDIVNASTILQGTYYTSRKTFGELHFDKRSRRKVMNYEKAKKLLGEIKL